MLYGALSHDCFHCVDYRSVNGPAEARAFITSVRGTVCGTRTETFELVLDKDEVENHGTWGRAEPLGGGFAGFGNETRSPSPGTSPAAEALRGRLARTAAAKRRAVLEAMTDRVQASVCLMIGVKAWQAGRADQARRALKACVGTGKPEAQQAAVLLREIARRTGR